MASVLNVLAALSFLPKVAHGQDCWNASSRVTIANGSQYAEQSRGSCATLTRKVCNVDLVSSSAYEQVVFDNGYLNDYTYADLALCRNDTGASSQGPYVVSQSLVIYASTNDSGLVEAGVSAALQLTVAHLFRFSDRLSAYRAALANGSLARDVAQGSVGSVILGTSGNLTYNVSVGDLIDHMSVRVSETSESSPFGDNTVSGFNYRGQPTPNVSVREGNNLWRVGYQVVVFDFGLALDLAASMQNVVTTPAIIARGFGTPAGFAHAVPAGSDPLNTSQQEVTLGPITLSTVSVESWTPPSTSATTTSIPEGDQRRRTKGQHRMHTAVVSGVVFLAACATAAAALCVSRRRSMSTSGSSRDFADAETSQADVERGSLPVSHRPCGHGQRKNRKSPSEFDRAQRSLGPTRCGQGPRGKTRQLTTIFDTENEANAEDGTVEERAIDIDLTVAI